ncbi:MAG: sugar transferase [Sphingomicrobium sp.]
MHTNEIPQAEAISLVSIGAKPVTSKPIQLRPDSDQVVPLFNWNRRQVRVAFYLMLMIADVLSIFVAFAFGSLVRNGDVQHLAWLEISLATTPIFIVSAMHGGAYTLGALQSVRAGTRRAIGALISSFAILFVVSYFLKAQQDVSRLSVGLGLITAVAAISIARLSLGQWIRQIFHNELTATVVIADESFVAPTSGTIVIDALKFGIRPEPRNPVMVQRFAQLLTGADRVIVACQREACSNWAGMLKGASVCGEILADEVQSAEAVAVARFGERTTLVVSTGPLSVQQSVFKRVFDIALSIPIVLFIAPVMLGIAIAIKLDSPGPVLFRQPRIGFGNRLFEVYKFRSMAASTTDALGSQSTLRDDARITRVGRVIRCTSLDELPQLFNVIGGSMSLVGPRPHAIGSYAGPTLFWDIDDRYSHRHLLKSGITGLAQIRGYRGTAHELEDLSRRLQSDLEYMNGWSIWRDVYILLKTFSVIVHPNAY